MRQQPRGRVHLGMRGRGGAGGVRPAASARLLICIRHAPGLTSPAPCLRVLIRACGREETSPRPGREDGVSPHPAPSTCEGPTEGRSASLAWSSRGRERDRELETSTSCLPHTPYWGCARNQGLGSCALFLTVNGLYASSDDVIELTPSNFNQEVIQSNSLWFVEFFAPWCGHCQRLTPEWKKVATALKDVVKVGAADADKHQSLGGQYGVQGFPTIKIFGSNRNRPEHYQGGRPADAIVGAAVGALRQLVRGRLGGGGYSAGRRGRSDSSSKKVTDDCFDKNVLDSEDVWMVEFYAPWCGPCKNLEPAWAAAATAVKERAKGKVKLAAADATANQMLTGRYGISGFPTIKTFQKGESPVDCDGVRTRSDIVSRTLDLFPDHAPPPELLELISEGIAKKTCEEHQLCVVAVLPHIPDTGAAGRNSDLDVLLKLADKHKKKMWGSSLLGEDLQHLQEEGCPPISTREPWGGKDGEPPAEGDTGLSDVELGDLEKDEL
ncbi:protein disulfide-isomerase A6-like [Myotis myotis]|uniref:protein disulfide-isomerase A6-like n=1 Tax=Myotis myotis TaxID=51298 RepID=UPI00174B113D|nr:protein disulfide-isomerase A6-like [Myotis myotis]